MRGGAYDELQGAGQSVDLTETLREIEERDKRDSERDLAPLRQADDALMIDSSSFDADQVTARVLAHIQYEDKRKLNRSELVCMAEQDEQKQGAAAGGASEFEAMFEESLRTVKPGGVVKGRVVGITATHVLIDVGYKSEGQIPIQEFTDRQGNVQVKVGDDVDVYFDSSEGEGGGIVLSRQRAENLKVWEDLEKAFNEEQGIEGHIVGKVKGGFKVDVGVPAFLPGSHVDIRPSRNLDRFIGTTDRFAILKFNRARGNVVVSRRALLEKERETLKKDILKVSGRGRHSRRHG